MDCKINASHSFVSHQKSRSNKVNPNINVVNEILDNVIRTVKAVFDEVGSILFSGVYNGPQEPAPATEGSRLGPHQGTRVAVLGQGGQLAPRRQRGYHQTRVRRQGQDQQPVIRFRCWPAEGRVIGRRQTAFDLGSDHE